MSVVGFDLGSQSCFIAIARHGGVEMVANEYSDRRSPTVVGFGPKQRIMGTSANSQQTTNYKNTLTGFSLFLGRKFSDPFVQEEMKEMPFEVVQLPNDGVGFQVMYREEVSVFTAEQVTAMILTYLKKTAEKALGKPVGDCVISIPSYFTDSQRRAMLDASNIAGLNCLRLFNDTTATALAYGIYKQDLPAEKEKPRNIVFVDIGCSALQVLVVSFQKGKLKVLSKAFDHSLGGRNFDRKVVAHFAADFKKRYKIDTMALPRQKSRLTVECEKLKKNMSAITTTIPLNIDCFADDKDVSGNMKREDFNKLCEGLLIRVRKPLEVALTKSGLRLEEIDAVEVVGGSCRVPAIKEIITSFFKKELSTTLNLDEAVARGCALQCAMLSPTFKVREFSIADIQPYPIQLNWQAALEGEVGEMVVFKPGDLVYHSKVLSFFRSEPFDLVACYADPKMLPCPEHQIGSFRVKDVVPSEEGEAIKVKVKVRLNIHGIFFVKSATLVEKVKPEEEEQMETEAPPPPPPPAAPAATTSETTPSETADGPTTEETAPMEAENDQPPQNTEDGQPSGEQQNTPPASNEGVGQQEEATPTEGAGEQEEATPTEGAGKQEEATPTESSGTSENDDSPKTDKKSDTKPPETKKQKKATVKYVDLAIDAKTCSLGKSALTKANEAEVNMRYQDQLENEKADAKNAVEEYVYAMRDQVEYSLQEFISEEEKTKFVALLGATEDWLYDEGEDQPKKVYVERLAEMKKYGDQVVLREKEFRERPHTFDELGSIIVRFEKIMTQYESGEDDQYSHIEEVEMAKVKEQIQVKRTWLNTQMQAYAVLPKHCDPPVKCLQIQAETKNMDSACSPIVNKPKPKVEPPKDDKPEGDKSEGGEAGEGDKSEGGEAGEGDKSEGGETKMEEDTPPQTTASAAEAADMELD